MTPLGKNPPRSPSLCTGSWSDIYSLLLSNKNVYILAPKAAGRSGLETEGQRAPWTPIGEADAYERGTSLRIRLRLHTSYHAGVRTTCSIQDGAQMGDVLYGVEYRLLPTVSPRSSFPEHFSFLVGTNSLLTYEPLSKFKQNKMGTGRGRQIDHLG